MMSERIEGAEKEYNVFLSRLFSSSYSKEKKDRVIICYQGIFSSIKKRTLSCTTTLHQ